MRGKGQMILPAHFPTRDHPRLCGEKLNFKSIVQNVTGSPPPMRGKEVSRSMFDASIGITPAYAGKSPLHRSPLSCTWDHPRLCGEKDRANAISGGTEGSPPPMRGKEADGSVNFDTKRITPAYAGKSRQRVCYT